ncbi:Riboflavin transporter MCH5 [Cyphellophora attinorum]|uniref:Riboflavin transporter MCH5 n=1 Tax=Cyphellophora attinorum TaxID=1664694 RepID=A0A0N0NL14_9EURO|nr:Riboflavin transporter MCH5 [Phialophora attinorum]KPI38771.1 Riboflavin transporter MCH5 [Phialophora attinorum]
MSTTTQTIELQTNAKAYRAGDPRTATMESTDHINRPSSADDEVHSHLQPNYTTAIPDGGYGWTVIASCSIMTFWYNGLSGSWGVIQTALLSTSLTNTPTATITFVGSLYLCLSVALGIFGVRLISYLGARWTSTLGVALLGVGEVGASFSTGSIGGLFSTCSLVVGAGCCLIYTISNSVPPQYFSRRLGLANGLVKGGGGIGATVLSIGLQALIDRVGTSWMFRVLGLATLLTGLPAAWLVKERQPFSKRKLIDLSLFGSVPFSALFVSSALGTFALFIPPFFLPLFAQSAGRSAQTGAALVAGFNACTTIGRTLAGPLCDRAGPTNTFLLTMSLNALSMLAIWPVAGGNLGVLILFAILNGVANGAFFVVLPTAVAKVAGPGREAVAMSVNTTGWMVGYLLGTPIAGILLQASGGADGENTDVQMYRPAIFYAGGVALLSAASVLVARLSLAKDLKMKV